MNTSPAARFMKSHTDAGGTLKCVVSTMPLALSANPRPNPGRTHLLRRIRTRILRELEETMDERGLVVEAKTKGEIMIMITSMGKMVLVEVERKTRGRGGMLMRASLNRRESQVGRRRVEG